MRCGHDQRATRPGSAQVAGPAPEFEARLYVQGDTDGNTLSEESIRRTGISQYFRAPGRLSGSHEAIRSPKRRPDSDVTIDCDDTVGRCSIGPPCELDSGALVQRN